MSFNDQMYDVRKSMLEVDPDGQVGALSYARKLREEVQEIIDSNCEDPKEYGDVLYCLIASANVAGVDLSDELREALNRFRSRTWVVYEGSLARVMPDGSLKGIRE